MRPPLTVRTELVAVQTFQHQLLSLDIGEQACGRVCVFLQLLVVCIRNLVVHHGQFGQSVQDAFFVEIQMKQHHLQFKLAVVLLEIVDLLLQTNQRVGQRRYHDAERRIGDYEQFGRAGQKVVQISFVFVLFEEKIVGHVEAKKLFATVELQVSRINVKQEALDAVAFGMNVQLFVNARTADAEYVRELASDNRLQDHLKTFVGEEVLGLLFLVHVR